MEQIPECFYRVSAKALVFDETKTKFLLLREDNDTRDFPGGWLDFGENPREGIIREFKEEAGIDVLRVNDLPSYFVTSKKPEKYYWIAYVFYETKIKNMDFISSKECQEVRFFTKEEAEKVDINPNVVEFLKQFVVG